MRNLEAAALVSDDWASFVGLTAAAGPAVWDRPTRLAGWRVEELARHVHWGMTMEAHALELAARSTAGSAPAEGGRRAGAVARAEGVHLTVPREEILPALAAARIRLVTALKAAPDEAGVVVPMPYGDLALPVARQVFVMEAAVHRSDLAHAVGADDRLSPGTHTVTAAVLEGLWGVIAAAATSTPPPGTGYLLRGRTVRVAVEFDGTAWTSPARAPAVVVRGDDDAVLLAALGRLPLMDPGLTLEGDRALGLRLKEFFPGP